MTVQSSVNLFQLLSLNGDKAEKVNHLSSNKANDISKISFPDATLEFSQALLYQSKNYQEDTGIGTKGNQFLRVEDDKSLELAVKESGNLLPLDAPEFSENSKRIDLWDSKVEQLNVHQQIIFTDSPVNKAGLFFGEAGGEPGTEKQPPKMESSHYLIADTELSLAKISDKDTLEATKIASGFIPEKNTYKLNFSPASADISHSSSIMISDNNPDDYWQQKSDLSVTKVKTIDWTVSPLLTEQSGVRSLNTKHLSDANPFYRSPGNPGSIFNIGSSGEDVLVAEGAVKVDLAMTKLFEKKMNTESHKVDAALFPTKQHGSINLKDIVTPVFQPAEVSSDTAKAKVESTLDITSALSTIQQLEARQKPSAVIQSLPPAISTALSTKSHFTDNLALRVQWMFSQALSSAEIMMDPPEMGPLSVKIQHHNGETNIIFHASHAATREALDDGLPKLKEMLLQQGINIGEAEVKQEQEGSENSAESGEQTAKLNDAVEESELSNDMLEGGRMYSEKLIDIYS